MDPRYEGPAMQEYLTGLVEDYYPRRGVPIWVNYDLFLEAKKQELFGDIERDLEDDETTHVQFFALPFAYNSEASHVGDDPFMNLVQHIIEREIPSRVLVEFRSGMHD